MANLLHVLRLCVDLLIQFVCAISDIHRTVPQDYIINAMASGDSQPGADRSRIDLRVHAQIPWNAPESVVTLVDSGFQNVTLVDMADVVGPPVAMGDLSLLRRQWPVSVVSGIVQKQMELELLHHAWKQCFRGMQTGCFPYCGMNIKHDMARHVSSFHLDLAQLWRCPVSWYTQWKDTPQDCVDHIRKKHSVNDSVKAANLGRWFPSWTVTREGGTRRLNCKSRIFEWMRCCLVRMDHSWYIIIGCLARVWHMCLCVGRSWLIFSFLPSGPAPMPSG